MGGTWRNSSRSGKYETKVLSQATISIAGGTYEAFWLRYTGYDGSNGNLVINYAYAPALKRIVEVTRNGEVDPAKLMAFTLKDSKGAVITGADPAFDPKKVASN